MYVQWAFVFSKGHPILKKTIDLIVKNITHNTYPNDIHKMTGPSVFSRAVNEVHMEVFHTPLLHAQITKDTDITYTSNNISYRIYGIDYTTFFCFKHTASDVLYIDKKHWTQEQQMKPLIQYKLCRPPQPLWRIRKLCKHV